MHRLHKTKLLYCCCLHSGLERAPAIWTSDIGIFIKNIRCFSEARRGGYEGLITHCPYKICVTSIQKNLIVGTAPTHLKKSIPSSPRRCQHRSGVIQSILWSLQGALLLYGCLTSIESSQVQREADLELEKSPLTKLANQSMNFTECYVLYVRVIRKKIYVFKCQFYTRLSRSH